MVPFLISYHIILYFYITVCFTIWKRVVSYILVVHIFCLHYIYLPRINSLARFRTAWNNHPPSSQAQLSPNPNPNQLWIGGSHIDLTELVSCVELNILYHFLFFLTFFAVFYQYSITGHWLGWSTPSHGCQWNTVYVDPSQQPLTGSDYQELCNHQSFGPKFRTWHWTLHWNTTVCIKQIT